MKQKSILFISHEASRTGAPILLLNFIRWFKENSDIPFQILLKTGGGELQDEFKEVGHTLIFNPEHNNQQNLLQRTLKNLGVPYFQPWYHGNKVRKILLKQDIGLIYTNTTTNGDIIRYLEQLGCPILCHVHELETTIRLYKSWFENFNSTKHKTSKFIAASQSVKDNLISNHDIPAEKIEVIYGFGNSSFKELKSIEAAREKVFTELNIPLSAQIVCASGTIGWRKGTDIFIQLAYHLLQNYRDKPVHFIWLGGKTNGSWFKELWTDVVKLELAENVHFLGSKTNPLDYFAACDVFTLVSREDPFPLVCLESASVSKPIVCFDKGGGMKEFVEDDCGFVVPYLDVVTMAQCIAKLLNSNVLRRQMGEAAARKVRERCDINVIAPKILHTIRECYYRD
jgi:glycosyltransferase involved in cell wall biosynthesis